MRTKRAHGCPVTGVAKGVAQPPWRPRFSFLCGKHDRACLEIRLLKQGSQARTERKGTTLAVLGVACSNTHGAAGKIDVFRTKRG